MLRGRVAVMLIAVSRSACQACFGHLTARAVNAMMKRTARNAGVPEAMSPHWLRHEHGSHALDRKATLAEVQKTLGHGNVSTTSGYLHAKPDSSSGLKLDPGVFLR